jgi:hypothetical protein
VQKFTSIVEASAPGAFRRAEVPLLCAYVQALSLSQWYAIKVNEGGDTAEAFKRWESATRTAISLATKLRLAPSTRLDKKTAERMGEELEGPKPWDLHRDDVPEEPREADCPGPGRQGPGTVQ